jgi:diguanylate cyclase (GGDEF)-like protein/PAS domain S-box-containing protein
MIFRKAKRVEKKFLIKKEIIEDYKSYNALIANSVHYLFDLGTLLQNRYYFSPIGHKVGSVTLDISQSVLGENIKLEKISNYAVKLDDLKKSYKLSDKDLEAFITHTYLVLEYLKKLNDIYRVSHTLYLSDTIEDLRRSLIAYFEKSSAKQRVLSYILYFVVFVFLIAIIVIYVADKRHKNELSRFKKAVENSDNSIVITDENRNFTYVNDAFERITGYKKEEVLGKNPKILKSGKTDDSVYIEMNKKLDSGEKWEGELINKRKDGSIYYEKVSISPIFAENGIEGFLAIKLDVTEYIKQKELIKNKSKEIQFLAYHDHLTGLPNRLNLQESLDHAIKTAKRSGKKLALLFIDLDRFKIINDTLGHHIGDEMLKVISVKIRGVLRESDILARVGGDEFVVLMEDAKSEKDAAQVAWKIISVIKEPIFVEDYTLNTTASVGIAIYPDDGKDVETIIKNADSAMYKAKDEGKDNYQFFTKKLSDMITHRMKIENALRDAIKNKELFLVYQPQYDLKNRKTISVEALLRWNSKELGFISPTDFIPIAEESGMIVPIGEWVFENACKEYLRLKEKGLVLERMCINVSSIRFREENAVAKFEETIKRVGIEAQNVEIEITERYIMEHTEQNLNILDKLRNIGFRISVDDFGTGYSSMSYLKTLPLDTIKIDKSFIDKILYHSKDMQITKAIITLSKSLGYSVVAEGIETKEQEIFLRENDCDIGQGYYFSKPLVSKDLEKFLKIN